MTVPYPVWDGSGWIDLPVPTMGGAPLVVPNVAALVYETPNSVTAAGSDGRERILLQRRDKPGEVVRGRLELPGGRWEAGEAPDVAVAREVSEETGITVTAVSAAVEMHSHEPHVTTAAARPLAVVVGVEGAYPSLHVLFECRGHGEPRPVPDEVAAPAWWGVDDVVALLAECPDDFVWHTAGMLRTVFSLPGDADRR